MRASASLATFNYSIPLPSKLSLLRHNATTTHSTSLRQPPTMASKVTPVTSSAHFRTLTSSSTFTVVDFYADWCGYVI